MRDKPLSKGGILSRERGDWVNGAWIIVRKITDGVE